MRSIWSKAERRLKLTSAKILSRLVRGQRLLHRFGRNDPRTVAALTLIAKIPECRFLLSDEPVAKNRFSYASRIGVRKNGMLGRPRLPDAVVNALYAEYQAGSTLFAMGRRHGKHPSVFRDLFLRRGLQLRPTLKPPGKHLKNGRFAPARRHSRAQIKKMIERSTRISVPEELQTEWRHWPLRKRASLLARLRKWLRPKNSMPTSPFSPGLVPFDYGSSAAWAVMEKANKGRPSRQRRTYIRLASQGVIWEGQLWFWSPKTGYVRGVWTPEDGRPCLHRLIWERHNGRRVPKGHVLVFLDGNRNNHSPENLAPWTRNDLCRENQAKSLTAKSRAMTSLLLRNSQASNGGTVSQVGLLHRNKLKEARRASRASRHLATRERSLVP